MTPVHVLLPRLSTLLPNFLLLYARWLPARPSTSGVVDGGGISVKMILWAILYLFWRENVFISMAAGKSVSAMSIMCAYSVGCSTRP